MTTIADCLTRIETTSRPIIQVRTIFRHFLSLAGEVFGDDSNVMVVSRDYQVGPVPSHSSTLPHWLPDSLYLPSAADATPAFAPSLPPGMEDLSEMLSLFPENEMFTPFSDHFPVFENDSSI